VNGLKVIVKLCESRRLKVMLLCELFDHDGLLGLLEERRVWLFVVFVSLIGDGAFLWLVKLYDGVLAVPLSHELSATLLISVDIRKIDGALGLLRVLAPTSNRFSGLLHVVEVEGAGLDRLFVVPVPAVEHSQRVARRRTQTRCTCFKVL